MVVCPRVQGKWWSIPVFLTAATLAQAQPLAERTLALDGETLKYAIRAFAPDAHLGGVQCAGRFEHCGSTAKLLNRYLSAGQIEDAALLSNAPRRRFEVLNDYQHAVGEDDFKRVFTQYFHPDNRLVAEIIVERHSLLIWHLREDDRYAGQYYVEIDGKVLLDDVPGNVRSSLRRILEAIRSGGISVPIR